MIQLAIQLGPAADRAELITAITDLQACLRTRLVFNEPHETDYGEWTATGTVWVRTERQRLAEELATIRIVARVLRKHFGEV